MPIQIDFPDVNPTYDIDRDCLRFHASADDQSIECLVTGELLLSRFGAAGMSEVEMQDAFQSHREELYEIARDHIENGWVDDQNRLFLTTRYTRLTVTFGEELSRSRTLIDAATSAQKALAQVIGPNAEEVIVQWDHSAGGEPGISLCIQDPAIATSVNLFLDRNQLERPSELEFALARLWGSILRARSQKLFLKLG